MHFCNVAIVIYVMSASPDCLGRRLSRKTCFEMHFEPLLPDHIRLYGECPVWLWLKDFLVRVKQPRPHTMPSLVVLASSSTDLKFSQFSVRPQVFGVVNSRNSKRKTRLIGDPC